MDNAERPRSRPPLDKEPLRHNEKPFERLVIESFDGPVLRLGARIKLLEIADSRKIRRGDAIDFIDATRRALVKKHAVSVPGRLELFFRQYAVFVACYVAFALVWCVVMSLSPAGGSIGGQLRANSAAARVPAPGSDAAAAAPDPAQSQVHATRVHPPFDQ